MRVFYLFCFLVLGTVPPPLKAHYHILIPDKSSVKIGEKVNVRYLFGHPYESELTDTDPPISVFAVAPNGTRTILKNSLKSNEETSSNGKKFKAYSFEFTPEKRGDHIIVVTSSPFALEESNSYKYVDQVKTVIHVETQNGWDQSILSPDSAIFPFDLVPLNRPYGLLPGDLFRFEIRALRAKKIPGKDFFNYPSFRFPIEVEKFNLSPPKEIPLDEFVTQTLITGQNAEASITLRKPGWIAITAIEPMSLVKKLTPSGNPGKKLNNGKKEDPANVHFLVRHRSTLWLYVDEKPIYPPMK